MSIRLRSRVQIAMERAQRIKTVQGAIELMKRDQAKKAAWAARLDPAAYTCRREGASWIAEGPAGQRFDYSRTEQGGVLCISASGGIYLLTPQDDGEIVCDCPSAARNDGKGCKHLTAWKAVKMAHRMSRKERIVA